MSLYQCSNYVSKRDRNGIERMIISKSKDYGAEITWFSDSQLKFRVKDTRGHFKKFLEGQFINTQRNNFYESCKSSTKWTELGNDINLFYYAFMYKGMQIAFTKMN